MVMDWPDRARPQACVKLNHQKMCALMAATCFLRWYRVRACATFILHYANELAPVMKPHKMDKEQWKEKRGEEK